MAQFETESSRICTEWNRSPSYLLYFRTSVSLFIAASEYFIDIVSIIELYEIDVWI
jgi:hypothetical protein